MNEEFAEYRDYGYIETIPNYGQSIMVFRDKYYSRQLSIPSGYGNIEQAQWQGNNIIVRTDEGYAFSLYGLSGSDCQRLNGIH